MDEMQELNELLKTLKERADEVADAAREAITPIANTVLPKLSDALHQLARALQAVGQVSAIFSGITQTAETTEKTVTRTVKALNRSLAGFDQINRLSGSKSGGTYTETVTVPVAQEPMHRYTQAIMDFFEKLPSFDLSPLQDAFARLKKEASSLASVIGDGLGWSYRNVLVPLGQWTVEDVAPVSVEVLTAALGTLRAILAPLQTGFASLWVSLQPMVAWLEERVISALTKVRDLLNTLRNTLENHSGDISTVLANLGTVLHSTWKMMEPVLDMLAEKWERAFRLLQGVTKEVVGGVLTMLSGISEFLAGVFTLDIKRALSGLATVIKTPLNAIILIVNSLLMKTVVGLNDFIKLINKVSFSIPNWSVFGTYAGKSWGPNLSQLTLPKLIPYLAQGAVLPANKPFLAMVGDQHHGTNVEAPLTTIQEAVASVMNDQACALAAGFEASVQVQKEILQAVLGIRIGDEVIGNAMHRYNRKLAMMNGGQL